MKKRIFNITVDVEDFKPELPFDTYLGKNMGRYWAVPRIIEILKEYNVVGTFYVDVFNATGHVKRSNIKACCDYVLQNNHELGIHTHPKGVKKESQRWMKDLNYQEQKIFFDRNLEIFNKEIDYYPTIHRAGGYAVNSDTLKIMKDYNIKIDNSIFWGKHDYYDINLDKNLKISKYNEITIVPIVSYFLCPFPLIKYNILKKTDINWMTNKEFSYIIKKNVFERIDLFLHSYSLINLSNLKYSLFNEKKLRYFIELLIKNNYDNKRIECIESNAANTTIPVIKHFIAKDLFKDFIKVYLDKI